MIDIVLTATTTNTEADTLQQCWVGDKLNQIDNKAEENYDQIKQYLTSQWGGGAIHLSNTV